MEKKICSCRKRIERLQEEDSDSEFVYSAQEHLRLWENKQTFFNFLLAMELLPCEVPGDGNCALWALLALEAGYVLRLNMATEEKCLELRQD